ncbi:hypothetical protein Tsubulata_027853, partial [Turnera subulata]
MTVKMTVTWNSILAGYVKVRGKLRDAQELFDKIPEPDSISYNTMLACYVNNSDVGTAQSFFGRIPGKDLAYWNTMISGFAQSGRMDKARELFLMIPWKNEVTWNAMISGYVECGDMEMAVHLFEMMPFKRVTGRIELAEKLFEEMPRRNLVTWNAMISGYVEKGRAEDGVKLFRTMMGYGIRPNPSSLSSVLLGCGELSAFAARQAIHQLVFKLPFCNHTTAGTPLTLFVQISRKDVVTWNAMISGYAQHGEGKRALGMKPDGITFVAVLLACSHAGLVDLGIRYFNSMARDFGIEAKQDHYIYVLSISLVELVRRLSDAVDLLGKMPIKPHPAIFGALLGACRIHKNIEIAEISSKNLLLLDPRRATAYVQLANVYAAMNRWDHVSRVLRSMKGNKIVQTPGYSWIEIKGVIHEFRSIGRVHPELADIHEKLNQLEKKMKLAGYVPELEFAIRNADKEQKDLFIPPSKKSPDTG